MSIGPTSGLAGSAAGSPLAQTKGSEVKRAQQDSAAQQRQVQGQLKAESAAGIGQTDEDQEAEDRDADGRLPWKEPPAKPGAKDDADATNPPPPAKDPSGQSGNLLDLSG